MCLDASSSTSSASCGCTGANCSAAILAVSPASSPSSYPHPSTKPDNATLVDIPLNLPAVLCDFRDERAGDHNDGNDTEATREAPETQSSVIENDGALKSLATHLDLLTAGSLFLLPSILPYLASALNSSAPSSSSLPLSVLSTRLLSDDGFGSDSASGSENWAATAWIICLPCIGILIPLSAFKIMSLIEEDRLVSLLSPRCWRKRRHHSNSSGTQRHADTATSQENERLGNYVACQKTITTSACAVCCGRRSPLEFANATTEQYQQRLHQGSAWIMSCAPTMGAIKRTLRTLRGDPPGYGPLALDLSATSSGESNMMHFAPSSPTLSEFESDNEIEIDVPGFSCICTTERQVQRQKRQQVSTLPRPKTIILASLGLWTVLMALSASMGFNSVSIPALSSSIRPTTITGSPSKPIASTQEDNSNDGMIDLSLWEPSSSLGHGSDDHASEKTLPEWPVMRQGGFVDDVDDNSNALESEREQEEFIESMTSLLGLNFDDLDRDANMKVEEPFATIKTKVVLLNRRDSGHQQQQHSEEKASDKEETTADQAEDVTEQDIEDFFEPDWLEALTMDPEDAHVFHDFLAQLEAEDAATAEQQPSVIEAADEFVVASLLENNLGCGYRPAFLPTFMVQFTPDWLKNAPTTIQNLFAANGNVASTSSPHTAHTRSQVFDYLFGWTDVMIVAVAMSLGGLLAGLAHAKTGYYQLLEQHYARYYDSPYGYTLTAGGSTSWTTLTSCLIISASAFALTLLMIFAECWDVPSVYFVGIGIAGMILVHAWIPNIVLMVDTTESDGDDVEFENEYIDGNNDANGVNGDEEKTVRDTWASPLTERRNACSLDESRRWEVTSRCPEASCFGRH